MTFENILKSNNKLFNIFFDCDISTQKEISSIFQKKIKFIEENNGHNTNKFVITSIVSSEFVFDLLDKLLQEYFKKNKYISSGITNVLNELNDEDKSKYNAIFKPTFRSPHNYGKEFSINKTNSIDGIEMSISIQTSLKI